jgi:hypothetical protein
MRCHGREQAVFAARCGQLKTLVQKLAWVAISLAGAGALAAIALERGEPLNGIWFVVAAGCPTLRFQVCGFFFSPEYAAWQGIGRAACSRHPERRHL